MIPEVPDDSFTFDDYDRAVQRTARVGFSTNENRANFLLGLAGETGEVLDEFKKVMFHGKRFDVLKLREELGDVLWYVSALAALHGIPLRDIARKNVEKLRGRYPDGFRPRDAGDDS